MDKLKKEKVLGQGMFGQTYLVHKNNKPYALKVQKVLEKDINPKKSQPINDIWRDIKFYSFIDKLSKYDQGYFMKLYEYEFAKCNHKHKRPYKIRKEQKKYSQPYDDSKWCMNLLLELKGQNLKEYLIKTNLTKKQLYSFILQICHLGNLMKSNGYTHNDLHSGNVTIQRTKNPKIKYKNKKYTLPVEFQLSAIDYGRVRHKSYNNEFDFKEEPGMVYYFDILYICWFTILKIDRYENDCQKKNKKLPWEKEQYFLYPVLKEMIKDKKFWEKAKKFNIDKYPKYAKYIEYYEKNNNIEKFLSPRKMRKKHYLAQWAMYDMADYYRIYFPKKYDNLIGWCSNHKPYLSKNELLKIYSYKNTNDLMKHCLDKLKLL